MGAGSWLYEGVIIGNGNGSPITFINNFAEQSGGGIYASGAGVDTIVALQDTSFNTNGARDYGGAIHARFGAQIYLSRGAGCPSFPNCNIIQSNYVTDGNGEGSAVYALEAYVRLQDHELNVYQPVGDNLQPSLLYAQGADAELFLENLQIWNNWAVSIIETRNRATVFGGYLSSAGNRYESNSGTHPSAISLFGDTSGNGNATFHSSIFWDHQGFFLSNVAFSVDCLIVSTKHNIPTGARQIHVVDPLFLGYGGLHVSASSPAVDFCDEALYPYPGALDIDGEVRGGDHLSNPNGSPGVPGGTFDIGMDEVVGPSPAPGIFTDGFESGGTGVWSATVP